MESNNFFSWLGSTFGAIIRTIVNALRTVCGGAAEALGNFSRSLANAIGMSPTLFNFALLVLGLLFLYAGIRAFVERAFFIGIIWLLLALFLLSGLIA